MWFKTCNVLINLNENERPVMDIGLLSVRFGNLNYFNNSNN